MISVVKRFFDHLIMESGAKRLLTCQFNIQILKKGNSCHQRFAKQTSSAVVTSDLFVVWYPGLCNKCHSVHGSFSGIPAGLHKVHTRLSPLKALEKYGHSKITVSNCCEILALISFILEIALKKIHLIFSADMLDSLCMELINNKLCWMYTPRKKVTSLLGWFVYS